MPDGALQDRVSAVRELMRLFWAERLAYLLAAVVSVGMILYFGMQIVSRDPTISSLTAIAGSGGLISIGMGRLLTMWTQALRLIAGQNVDG
jgi:protein-S-isoprenylcysteine O-methyltransferase Ste14